MPKPNLLSLQTEFWRGVTDESSTAHRASKLFRGDAKFSAEKRLGVYAMMYEARLVDALAQDFPLLHKWTGAARFEELACACIRLYPSQMYSLDRFGRHFLKFLCEQEGRLKAGLLQLAKLEWARCEVFLERNSSSVSADRMASVAAEQFGLLTVDFIDALRELTFDYDIISLVRALESDALEPVIEQRTQHCLIWRREYEVFHVEINESEHQALTLAREGRCLAEWTESFATAPNPAQALFDALSSWFTEGFITACYLKGAEL